MHTNQSIQDQLAEFGLSPDEADVYLLLLAKGSMTAKAVAAEQGIVVNSVYRIADVLVELGLANELDTRPKQFQAVSPSTSLKQLADARAKHLQTISRDLIRSLSRKQNPNRLNMELLTGRQALFERFVELAEQATEEILVISIGEPVPETIWKVTKQMLGKGVKPKYLFHKYDKENILLVKRWLAMGAAVRYLPGEGYHLNVFDDSAAILSASNPKQSRERSGVVIYNEAIIEMLRNYFFQQWGAAKKL